MKIEVASLLNIKLLSGIIFLLIITTAAAFAQDTLNALPHDSSEVNVRTADPQTLQEVTNEEVFKYKETAQNPETLWTRIQRWILQSVLAILNNKWASFFIKLAFFGTFAIVLVALLNQLLGGNIKSAFSKKRSNQGIRLDSTEIHLRKENLDKMLKEALSKNMYSSAVRILYLMALQELNELELINLKPEKTNHDYLRELDQHESSGLFSHLTLYYEYVEYGDFKIEKSGYDRVKEMYEQFKKIARPQ